MEFVNFSRERVPLDAVHKLTFNKRYLIVQNKGGRVVTVDLKKFNIKTLLKRGFSFSKEDVSFMESKLSKKFSRKVVYDSGRYAFFFTGEKETFKKKSSKTKKLSRVKKVKNETEIIDSDDGMIVELK